MPTGCEEWMASRSCRLVCSARKDALHPWERVKSAEDQLLICEKGREEISGLTKKQSLEKRRTQGTTSATCEEDAKSKGGGGIETGFPLGKACKKQASK